MVVDAPGEQLPSSEEEPMSTPAAAYASGPVALRLQPVHFLSLALEYVTRCALEGDGRAAATALDYASLAFSASMNLPPVLQYVPAGMAAQWVACALPNPESTRCQPLTKPRVAAIETEMADAGVPPPSRPSPLAFSRLLISRGLEPRTIIRYLETKRAPPPARGGRVPKANTAGGAFEVPVGPAYELDWDVSHITDANRLYARSGLRNKASTHLPAPVASARRRGSVSHANTATLVSLLSPIDVVAAHPIDVLAELKPGYGDWSITTRPGGDGRPPITEVCIRAGITDDAGPLLVVLRPLWANTGHVEAVDLDGAHHASVACLFQDELPLVKAYLERAQDGAYAAVAGHQAGGSLPQSTPPTDFVSPPPPPRVCMSIRPECSDLFRVLVLNDPAARCTCGCRTCASSRWRIRRRPVGTSAGRGRGRASARSRRRRWRLTSCRLAPRPSWTASCAWRSPSQGRSTL